MRGGGVGEEGGAGIRREGLRDSAGDRRVDGLLVDYLRFFGDFDTIATDRHWYRREVRVVRLGADVRSYSDAQGFRVGAAARRLRARVTGARMFHYGWARPPHSMRNKLVASQEIFTDAGDPLAAPATQGTLTWTPLLRRFAGAPPGAVAPWAAARPRGAGRAGGPARLRLAHVRLYPSDWLERFTGARLFEYRNYGEV